MKNISLVLIVICVGVFATTIYLRQHKSVPATETVVETPVASTAETPAQPEIRSVAHSEPVAASQSSVVTEVVPAAAPVSETKPVAKTNAVSKIVDALLVAQTPQQKHALFEQLRKDWKLDEATADLKQRMTQNPAAVEIPVTLGIAQLNKLRSLKESNADFNDIAILAMQADQSFNSALKLDPQNWEAQFLKASSMYYWPANEARDNEVVQRLSSLIDQQETMTSNPKFARTYAVLGDQFQKIGQPEKAEATWRLGLQKFPGDQTLLQKLAQPGTSLQR